MEKHDKISGFKTPEKYFLSLEERLNGILKEEKFPENSGFTVPDRYFSQLENSVMTRIQPPKNPKAIPLFSKKYIGYAAAVAACAIIGFMIFNFNDNRVSLDSVQFSLIDKYVDEGNLNYDLYDLAAYLETDDIENIDFGNAYISPSNLKDYLLENAEESIFLEEDN